MSNADAGVWAAALVTLVFVAPILLGMGLAALIRRRTR